MKNTLDIGEITYGDMLSVLPFSNEIDLFKIKGKDLREAFEYSAGLLAPNGELLDDDGGAFLQVQIKKIHRSMMYQIMHTYPSLPIKSFIIYT